MDVVGTTGTAVAVGFRSCGGGRYYWHGGGRGFRSCGGGRYCWRSGGRGFRTRSGRGSEIAPYQRHYAISVMQITVNADFRFVLIYLVSRCSSCRH